MSSNYFGQVFRFTTWGESHGEAIGCVIDGCPAGVPLSEPDIQFYLNLRRPAQSKFTTQRKESDQVRIMSGVFNGKTTGTPISLIIHNEDQRSQDYGDIKDKFRPSHADYTYHMKYGFRDYRGGGRSSARETAMRVAAGAVARKALGVITQDRVKISAGVVQMGKVLANMERFEWETVYENPVFCPDPIAAQEMQEHLDSARKSGLSLGALIQVVVKNVPVGLGEPIYHKLDSEIAKAIMSINAVKGVEIGCGFACASLTAQDSVDEITGMENGAATFSSNNSGGILGGISTGQDIVVRFAVKPTSSVTKEFRTVDIHGSKTTISTKGRHDPCVGIRAVPVGEAMLACVLLDAALCARLSKI